MKPLRVSAVFGTNGSLSKTSIMFLGGDYAAYWYDYAGAEGQITGTLSGEASVGVGRSIFVAFNSDERTYNPVEFAGKYNVGGGSGALRLLNDPVPTKERTTWNITSNWIMHALQGL